MGGETDPAEFIDREPDDRLLGVDAAQLPQSVGRPQAPAPNPAHERIVAFGATLTGVSLIAGAALIVLGIVEAISGGFDAAALAALAVGVVLVATHWGWVHVAEATASGLDSRGNRDLVDANRRWLNEIEPYTRWEVSSSTEPDGSIAIVTVRHRPIASRDSRFTFVREVASREVHSGEAQAAVVAGRAEELRRLAAEATAAEHERYRAAREASERARLANADEQERLAAVRAASSALSEQINAHLRDPPLTD